MTARPQRPRNEPRRLDLDRKCDPRPARPVMTDEARALAKENLPLAIDLAGPFKGSSPAHNDELEAAALMGLCQAAAAWDPGRGVPFGAFARVRILGAIRDEIARELRRGLAGEGPAPKVLVLPPGAEAPDAGGDDDPDDGSGFDRAILPLGERDRRVFSLVFEEGLSQRDAGRRLGLSRDAVSAVLRRGVRRMRAAAGA